MPLLANLVEGTIMQGRALVAALGLLAVSAPAFGVGYIERFDVDPAGFMNYGDGGVTEPNIWVDDVNGNPGGHIYGGPYEYQWRGVVRDMSGGLDPLSGSHPGEALVVDAKGRLHGNKGYKGWTGLILVAEVMDENDKYHAWIGYFMYCQWNTDVALGDENTWMRAILPINVNAWSPYNFSGGPNSLAWQTWTEPANMVNGSPQDDLEWTLATIDSFALYGAGSMCYLDNIGYTYNGDANGDGVVGIADLVALADNYGANDPNTVGWMQGDFNTDFQVGIADLVALADNYGKKTSDLLPAFVPEPATLLLIAVGAVALRRRRR